ncbi:MAG: DUF5011 domain-containing protein, partial [Verrucomicrobiota bacterium]|nr:DUF5011 domain-containing protein [Verrucomicrobiota bacterium]
MRVVDRTPPVITLLGQAIVTHEAKVPYQDAGATAADSLDGSLTAKLSITSTVITDAVGAYSVHYSVSDNAGNIAEAMRTVHISDTTPPAITLLGQAEMVVEAGQPFVDPGAQAEDKLDGDVSATVGTTGSVDVLKPGVYELVYTVSDYGGNTAEQIRIVVVQDTTGPVVELLGQAAIPQEAGVEYIEPGFVATDIVDGDVTANVQVEGVVDVKQLGSQVLEYSAADAAGNLSGVVLRTVTVADTQPPLILLNGEPSIQVEAGSVYVDSGATATDVFDGEISSSLESVSNVRTDVPGLYSVKYNVSDVAGNAASEVARLVDVVDTTGPVISLTGENVAVTAYGLNYVDPGVTARDLIDGDVSDRVDVMSYLDTTRLGTYEIHYSATDKSGNLGEPVTRVVVVEDLVPPVVELIGGSKVFAVEGSIYADLGAIATDDLDGDLTEFLEITSDVDTSKPGRYTVRFNVSDLHANVSQEVVREVTVRDSTPPVLTLLGEPIVHIEAGDVYLDAGAVAMDAVDGEVTDRIAVGLPESLAKPGDYVVTYDVGDLSDNRAPQLTRQVIVRDTTPPLLQMKGDSYVLVEAGESYTDAGVVAIDSTDGDLSAAVLTVNPVDTRRPGEYTITYDVADASGNPAIQRQRIVSVRDTQRPELTLVGAVEIEVEVGREYSDAGATAVDAFEGNLTGSIEVDNQVDAATPGYYVVLYNVTDSSANQAEQIVRRVVVVDRVPPVITLVGDAVFKQELKEPYVDLGATADDNVDGDLTEIIEVINPVDVEVDGTYEVKYNVVDSSGNAAAEVTRVVIVGDTGQPVIELTGGQSVATEAGLPFVDPGYFAEDKVDGDLTANVAVSGSVDTATIGTYRLAYNVTDSGGNAAVEMMRTVTVQDSTPPNVKLLGAATVVLELGQAYVEEGATAADSLNGDVTESVLIKSSVDLAKPGQYEVAYTAQDLSGNVSEPAVRLVEIRDTTAPTIQLIGESSVQVEAGTQYIDAGATVNDPAVGDITPRLNVSNPVDADRLGEYIVTYTASDHSGNRADTVTRSVDVRDTTGPLIALTGGAELAMEAGDAFVDPGATAVDGLDGDLSAKITVAGFVDTEKYGEYTLTYAVADSSGNRTEAVRIVVVRDTVPPVLKLLGSTDYQITKGQVFNEPGYEAIDLVDGDLSSNVDVLGKVDTSQVGIYELIYTVKDKVGNEAAGQRRTVEVQGDKIPPVIQLIGRAKVVVEAGMPYVDAGATAIDRLDGDVADLLVVDNPVDVMVPGEYRVTFNAVDRDGNVSEPAYRTVTVEDTIPPVLSLKGELTVVLEVGEAFVDPGYEVSDSLDGDLAGKVQVEHGIDVQKKGQYIVLYNVSDTAGNAATEANRIVMVGDTGSPIIRLVGESTIVMEGGVEYADPGATAEDRVDGDLTGSIVVSNPVDVYRADTYQVTYDVEDTQGNPALQVVRIVIIEDHVPPVIELIGDAELETQAGYEFTDPGVKATDNLDGDLATRLITDSTVNAKVPGDYSIKYLVEDRVGNKAETMTRVVRVVDTEGPVITLRGEATVQVEAGGSYEEPGATASDLVEGDLTAVVKTSGEVNASVTGSYVVRYEAQDSRGNAGSSVARRVVVLDTTPPTVKRIEPLQVLEGKPLQLAVSANDNGRADSVLTYFLQGAPDGVSFSETAPSTIEWTPAEEQGPGVYRFDVVVSDGKLETIREILIEVEEVNAPPVALETAVVATEDGQVKIQLAGTDIEGAALTYRVVDPPQNGQLAGSGSDLSYVPVKDFNGQDSFTFAVSDGELESASAKVSITVEPAEDAPQITAVNPLTGAVEDEAFTVSHGALLEASDAFDADGDPLTFLIGEPTSGTLLDAEGEPLAKAALAPGESVSWLPPADAHGALEAFPVLVADALGQAERTVAVTIEVAGVPDDPALKWAKPDGIVYGTALGQVQLSAAADVPGVFEYKPALGTVLKAGNGQSLKAKFTPEDTTEYNVVEARVTIDVALAKPQVSWFNPGDIDAGTALSGVQLNATADVPGQFAYDPAAGTVFEVREGEIFSVFTLKVQFTPEDESNYLPADREVEITVLPRAPENDAPSILVEPEGFAVVVGGEGQLSVSAVGLKPIVYQWYRNGEAITGATNPVLKLESISVEEAGNYEVQVANNLGETRSKVALLNVLEPPVLEDGLNSATINLGDPHKFILIATGTEPIAVEWYKDGELIDGEDARVLDLPSVQRPDAGLYHVRLANAGGEFVSEPARLSLNLPVEIVTGLKDRTVRVGTDVVLSVEAEGARPFTYRWFFDDNELPDEKGEELVLNSIRQLQKGLYAVEVSNQINAVRSEAFLNVNQGPKFTRQPLAQSVNEGGEAVFKVAVSGSKPLFFQWYFNGAPIEGALEPDLTLTGVTRESAGFYNLRVRNEAGESEGDSALLTVNLPLELVSDLEDAMALVGGSAKLGVEVGGTTPTGYRWFHDGALLEEADGAVLKLENLSLANAGRYWVEITNPVGTIRSGEAALDVVALPEIVQAPVGQRVVQGQPVQFSVIAGGSKPLTYQWLKDGIALEGETGTELQLEGITISDQADYAVLVTNRGGTVESAAASLVVVLPVQITQDVEDLVVSEGSIARFTVEADGTGPLGYQWYYGGSPIENADGPVFEIGIVTESDRGLYQVEVKNEAGRVRSREAKLNVSVMPKLTRQVEDQAILAGSALKLQASASGTEPLTYNWYRQGALFQSGGSDLLIENITPGDAGLYQVEVVNAVGSVRGSVFEVEVLEPVTIVTQPKDTRANEGAVAVLKVVATGTGPFTYQWYHNGEAVDGADGPQLRILSVEDYHRGVYEVDVTNSVGSVRSASAKLKVVLPPVILAQPAPYTGNKGDQLILRVAAGGSEPLSYHWQKDGEQLLVSDEPLLKINSTVPDDSGIYSVVVRNTAGEAASEEAQVVIYQPIVISQQPQPARAISGETALLQVEASGSEPLTYQWLFNNSPIAGATSPGLTVSNVGRENEGSYQVVINNPAGSVVSDEARLAVVQPVQILAQPEGAVKIRGEELTLEVAASGTQPFVYRWFRDSTEIKGANGTKLEIANVQLADSGVYHVTVSNEGGEVVSEEALVTVYDPITIVQQPDPTRRIQGTTAVFTVEATGSAPLTYQWRFNNQAMPGETGATLTLSNVQPVAEGSYQVVVKNPAGTVASREAKLSLILPIEITAQPGARELVVGDRLELRIGASGSPVIEYQWFKDGDALEGEVSETLVVESVQVADTGIYRATAKNEAGTVSSETAKVDVYAPLAWVA